jgi:hypothetical protein
VLRRTGSGQLSLGRVAAGEPSSPGGTTAAVARGDVAWDSRHRPVFVLGLSGVCATRRASLDGPRGQAVVFLCS